MIWALCAIGAAVVVAIAFGALGIIVGRLEQERSPAVYELEEALEWIADRLHDEVTARLSYDDVRQVLLWHLDWLAEVGVSSPCGTELAGEDVIAEGAIADDEAAVNAIVARSMQASSDQAGSDHSGLQPSLDSRLGSGQAAARQPGDSPAGIEPIDVVCVLDLQMRYLARIGALSEAAE